MQVSEPVALLSLQVVSSREMPLLAARSAKQGKSADDFTDALQTRLLSQSPAHSVSQVPRRFQRWSSSGHAELVIQPVVLLSDLLVSVFSVTVEGVTLHSIARSIRPGCLVP